MSDGAKIEWTDATWNPITGCSVVSPGCTNCYAMKLAGSRLAHHPSRAGLTRDTKAGPVWTGEVRLNEQWLDEPLRWRRPRKIFVCAHGDLFAEGVPDAWIERVFAVMALCPQHVFQVLTKRPERMRAYLAHPATARAVWELACDMVVEHGFGVVLLAHPSHASIAPAGRHVHVGRWPLRNVWLGVSVEDQRRADERIPILLDTPAAVRWISAEPLLGPVDLDAAWHGEPALDAECWGDCAWCEKGRPPLHNCQRGKGDWEKGRSGLDWVVAGGESGPGARPMHPDWARSLRDQCAAAGVPFLFKQWGTWAAKLDREREDPDWRADYSGRFSDSRPDIAWLNSAGGRGFHGERFHVMSRVGKKAAGRTLDDVTHDGFPEERSSR